jgi:hypothetical protein
MSGIAAEDGTFLVANGGFLRIPGGDIRRFAGYPTADFSVVDYLVLNQLTIVVHARPVVLDLCLNAQDFDRRNINAVIDRLHRHPFYLNVRMRIFLGGWLNESFLRIEEAVDRLRAIARRQGANPRIRLRIAERNPARIRHERQRLPVVTLEGKPLVVGYGDSSRDIALPL